MGPLVLAAGLIVYNSLANRWKPFHAWAYVPANVVMAGAVVAMGAWAFDLDRRVMGLRWESAWIGAAIGVAAVIPVFALLPFERGRSLLRDERLAGVRGAGAAYMLAIRIPIGTAVVEEVVFRGVLLGSVLHRGSAAAVAVSSVAFGLWHTVPTLLMARQNRLDMRVVPAGVLLTAAAGVFLGWLRIETGSVAAPLLLHASINSLAAAAAMIALSGSGHGSASQPPPSGPPD